jgi:hypothetical protein
MVTHVLEDDQDPDVWAKILTRRFQSHVHNGDGGVAGFNRRIVYPRSGWRWETF